MRPAPNNVEGLLRKLGDRASEDEAFDWAAIRTHLDDVLRAAAEGGTSVFYFHKECNKYAQSAWD